MRRCDCSGERRTIVPVDNARPDPTYSRGSDLWSPLSSSATRPGKSAVAPSDDNGVPRRLKACMIQRTIPASSGLDDAVATAREKMTNNKCSRVGFIVVLIPLVVLVPASSNYSHPGLWTMADNDIDEAVTATTNTTAAAAARGMIGEEVESSPNDLVELVRAVKFANTNASIREVHTEISITMAQSNYPTYAFLKDVKLNDVKKVWKKAIKGGKVVQDEEGVVTSTTFKVSQTVTTTTSHGESNETSTKATSAKTTNDGAPSIPADGIIRFYTIGDGSVKTLVENYSKQYAQKLVSISEQTESSSSSSRKDESSSNDEFTHFFLNVPADLSGSRPHQALINYSQDNYNIDHSISSGSGTKTKKGDKTASPSFSSSSSSSSNGNSKKCEIFKIQIAALPPGMGNVLTPMLLYNKDRSAKTFLHPPSSTSDNNDDDDDDDDDEGGYNKIRTMIIENGSTGALGVTGGTKAYFYGYTTKVTSELLSSGLVVGATAAATNDIVSIRTTELVLNQTW